MRLTKYKSFLTESKSTLTTPTTPDDFVKHINKLKNQNKNSWYTFTGTVNDKDIKIKGYGTWLQIFKVDGIDYSNPMEQSVKDYKNSLLRPFNEDTQAGDVAQATGPFNPKTPIQKKKKDIEDELDDELEDVEDDLDEDNLNCSAVGLVGRTGFKDAENHIQDTKNIKIQLRKLIKQVGGKTVLLKLLNTMNSIPTNEEESEFSKMDKKEDKKEDKKDLDNDEAEKIIAKAKEKPKNDPEEDCDKDDEDCQNSKKSEKSEKPEKE